jgi:hypothetical protein
LREEGGRKCFLLIILFNELIIDDLTRGWFKNMM